MNMMLMRTVLFDVRMCRYGSRITMTKNLSMAIIARVLIEIKPDIAPTNP